MAATRTGLIHDEVTTGDSTAMVNLPAYSSADQARAFPTQTNNQTHLQADSSVDVIQDVPPSKYPQEGVQSAPMTGGDAIIDIQAPKLVTPLDRLLEEPAWIDCPFCHRMAETKVDHSDSSTTQLYGVLCCLLCGIIGVCVPYLCHWAQETDHTCSRCGNRVAHKPYDGPVQALSPPQARMVPSKYAEAGRIDQGVGTTNQAPGRTDQAAGLEDSVLHKKDQPF